MRHPQQQYWLTTRQALIRLVVGFFVLWTPVGASVAVAAIQLFGSEFEFPQDLYAINHSTGVSTVIGTTGSYLPGLDFRQNGTLYGAGSSLATVNVGTGAASIVGPLDDLMVSIAFSPSDQLFAVSNLGDTLYRLNPATGATLSTVSITGTAFSGEIRGIDFAPDGTMYGIGAGLYQVNPSTGNATRVTPSGFDVAAGFLFHDLDYGADGLLRSVTSEVNSQLYTINPNSGLGTLVGATGFNMQGLASVPEPNTLALTGLASLGVAILGWRRRKCAGGLRRAG